MKKLIFFFLSFLSLIAFVSCEEEEAPLRFSTENISNTNDVKLEYYSPDPHCIGKMYYLVAYGNSSEITLVCTNGNSIFLNDNQTRVTSPDGLWAAEVVSSNSVTIRFAEADKNLPDDAEKVIYEFLRVSGMTKKGLESTSIHVDRVLVTPEDLYK